SQLRIPVSTRGAGADQAGIRAPYFLRSGQSGLGGKRMLDTFELTANRRSRDCCGAGHIDTARASLIGERIHSG
nr:hypothetical protein [Streptomyces sp. DSM 41633]